LWGGAPKELFTRRLKQRKLTFLYHERMYKQGYEYHKMPFRALRHFFIYKQYPTLHLLCASAYASADFARTGCFINKAYKWGYFPELKKYDSIDNLLAQKQKNTIVWVARFIDWKHPEVPLEIAKRLKSEGYDFQIKMIGNGEMMDCIRQMIETNQLEDCVQIMGSMLPHQVRDYMERSEIFLFTSDKYEGWGAVVNESMNSCCAVIASHAIGSVPFLIKNGKNGLIYQDGNIDDAVSKIKWLLDYPEDRKRLSKQAYETIETEWNATVAAERLLTMSEAILRENKHSSFDEGICSHAPYLSNDWIKKTSGYSISCPQNSKK
jgi:glycosyltransferase involved in cell wall biosynthesis